MSNIKPPTEKMVVPIDKVLPEEAIEFVSKLGRTEGVNLVHGECSIQAQIPLPNGGCVRAIVTDEDVAEHPGLVISLHGMRFWEQKREES